MSMEEYRQQLNELDAKMVELYVQRMKIAESIGQYKKENNLPVKDRRRERELMDRLAEQAGEDYENGIRGIYSLMIDQSCARQKRIMAEPAACL